MCCLRVFMLNIFLVAYVHGVCSNVPIVVSTWNFREAVAEAWRILQLTGSALDSVEAGCTTCENLQCDFTVGYGGSPDENGESTLDAMIMDGTSMDVGAVASLRRIKRAAAVARAVLQYTNHTLIAGDLATAFAKHLGFVEESLTTPHSADVWTSWLQNNCQPNFWKNVEPNPRQSCGPYKPSMEDVAGSVHKFGKYNHDTIGMIAIDEHHNVVAGTSTNGANHKIPGRVGDSPIPGAGAYADSSVGGAAATGDGDVMIRFLPSFLAVEEMRRGSTPKQATMVAIQRIIKHYNNFSGAVVAVSKDGEHGAACYGLDSFPYTVMSQNMKTVETLSIPCISIDVEYSANIV